MGRKEKLTLQHLILMPKPTDEILDWVVSDTPFTEEADAELPLEAPTAPRSRVFTFPMLKWAAPRRVTLMLALAAAVILLAVWLGTAWSDYQLKQEIQALIQSEDNDPLIEFFELPLPLLQPSSASGTVETLTRVSPNLLRADVRRTFLDGLTQREMSFLQPQFYRRIEGGWERTTPPEDFWGAEVLEHTLTQRLTLRYPAVDAEFVKELMPKLEAVLARACAEWQCPPDVTVTVAWGSSVPHVALEGAPPNLGFPNYGSRLLGLIDYSGLVLARPEHLILGSPHAAGLPADAASEKFYTETLSLLILRQLAFNLSRNPQVREVDDYQNPFRIALVARLAARLGLENPRTPELVNPNPHRQDDELWRNNYLDANTLRSALVITNRLLQTQPITAETKLLKALANANGVLSWMIDGLNLSPREAIELSDKVNFEPWPIENLAADASEILLECVDGIQVWRGAQTKPEPLLTGYFPESTVGQFSPDGQKLIAHISGQMAVIDFSKDTLIWLPNGGIAQNGQWLDNETLAYQLFGDAVGVRLYQLYEGEVLAFDSDIDGYAVSPNGTQAIITRLHANGPLLTLMPVRGGEEQAIDFGFLPQWSSKGDAVAFVSNDGSQVQIKLANLQKDETVRLLFNEEMLGKSYTANVPYYTDTLTQIQWSLTGEWLAFNLRNFGSHGNSRSRSWIGIVRRDGEGFRLLAEGALHSNLGGFSADGRYFALVKVGEGVLIHNLARNITRLIPAPGLQNIAAQWSPAGYEVLISTTQGVRRILDARQTNPRLISLSGPECYRATWVP